VVGGGEVVHVDVDVEGLGGDSDGGGCRLYARRKRRPTRRRTASVSKTCAPIDDHARLARAEMSEPGSLRHGPTPVPRGGQSSPIVLVVTKKGSVRSHSGPECAQ
jgi:hypothetical protein